MDHLRLYPSIAVAAGRANKLPALRLWLLCLALNPTGAVAVEHLVREAERRAISKPRRLVDVLRGHEPDFWQLAAERIWRASAYRLAQRLGVPALTGYPAQLPLDALDGPGTQRFKALLYAAWHAGRPHQNPISRTAIKQATGLSPRTQHAYERLLGMAISQNYKIIGPYTLDALKAAYYAGNASVFKLTDRRGLHGKPGAEYVAYRLSNSYAAPMCQARKGRQAKINGALDLVEQPSSTGNGVRGNGAPMKRLYYHNPKAHARAAGDVHLMGDESSEGVLIWR